MPLLAQVFDYPSVSGAATIAAKTAVIYVFLIVGLRVLGKRELGQLSLYDLVMVIILGNAVQNAMINNDNTLGGGLVAATVLLLLNWGLNRVITHSRTAERALVGDPILIVHDGKPLRDRMQRQGITMDQLMAALREHGVDDVTDVHMAVLESDGTISVVPAGTTVLKTRRHYRGLRL
ncbi:MAG TPA: YetF domain-containing protein [Acidimicrobiia bacterium]|nr:YetF domain-containing protein [Acidimicrobiia bacterium]